MAWNPTTYNKFKPERQAPFYDLLRLVRVKPGLRVIDLGCGTGELTKELATHLPNAVVLGIDASAEMLKEATAFEQKGLQFAKRSIEEQMQHHEKWDLIFSNAALQWVDDHYTLFPKLIAMVNPGGQLAIQMPDQLQNITNRLLEATAAEMPFSTALQHWKRSSPVLTIEAYSKLFFENGSTGMTVYEKVYPLILPGTGALYDWVSGTALLPYLEKLEPSMQELFIKSYKEKLATHFTGTPVFYPFKRIILEASFG